MAKKRDDLIAGFDDFLEKVVISIIIIVNTWILLFDAIYIYIYYILS